MTTTQRVLSLVGLVCSAGLVVAGCGPGDPPVEVKPDAVLGVSATASTNSIIVGGTAIITATPVKGDAGASVAVDYSSNAPAVASVNSSGQVTGLSAGSATITVTANGSGSCCTSNAKAAQVTITVTAAPPALTGTLTVAPNPANVNQGSTVTLVPNPTKGGAVVAVSYTYTSSQLSTATVDGAGVVTGVAAGQAVITVVATGTGAGFATTVQTAVVTINVSALPPALTGTMTISPAQTTLTVDATQQLTPTVTRASPSVNVTYTYQSSSPAIAVMNGDVVRGISPGTANITVTATGSGAGFTTQVQTAVSTITVQAGAPAIGALTVTASPGTTIGVGTTTTLTPVFTPAGAGVTTQTTFTSGTPAVATVSGGGVVTAVSAGTSVITTSVTGQGSGFTTITRTATTTITVTAAACSVIDQGLDFATVGAIAAADCQWRGSAGKVDFFRVNRGSTPATVLRLDALANGFTNVGVVAATSTAPPASLQFNNSGTAVSGTFLLPPGQSYLGVISNTGALGPYSASGSILAEDIVGCRQVVAFATVTTSQRLSSESCPATSGPFDKFLIFAPGRTCTVEMLFASPGTSAPLMTDTYLEAWRGDGSALFDENDDYLPGGTFESRLTFANCQDPAGNFIEIRARAYDDGPPVFGAYRLRITFGP